MGITVDELSLSSDSAKISEILPRLLEIHNESFGVALVMLAAGLFTAYMGIRLFKTFLAVSGLIVGGGTSFFVYQNVIVAFPGVIPAEWIYAPWVVAALGGSLCSALFIKAWNVGTYVLCAYGGVTLSILVKGMISNYSFGKNVDQNLLKAVFGVLGLVFARFLTDVAIICASALCGAFLIFLGLDNLKTVGFRKFIKESIASNGGNISEETFKGELAYCLVGVVFVTLTGIYIQIQNRPKSRSD